METPTLSRAAKTYVWSVVACGAIPVLHSLVQLMSGPPSYEWLGLAALTLLSAAFAIRVPSLHARISSSEAFIFALALLFGPAPATLTCGLKGLIVSLSARKRTVHRLLFNVAEFALTIWISSSVFYLMAGVEPLYSHPVPLRQLLVPLVAMTTSYFLLNVCLSDLAICLENRIAMGQLVRSQLSHLSLNYLATSSLVVMLVYHAQDILFVGIGLAVPLFVMSYASTKSGMARVEDANRHLAEVNKLYLSTVETLAMAIDAKDQITHGHIRRVQVQAVALARTLGVNDEREIKALEAAALLHDLGKLAVPEHILNKPGTLTPAEWEQMKSHASVGADILSKIDFPYPVTPIVRHHHESWDGSGYPDGISGNAIPLGARILAVADCFDALISDRPYRPRLSEQAAIQILQKRRGTVYDPFVVDTFIEMRKTAVGADVDLASWQRAEPARPQIAPLGAVTRAEPPHEVVGRELGRELGAIPVDTIACVLYHYDPTTDRLTGCPLSDRHQSLSGLQVRRGEKITGWVAANGKAIVNADATLDLGELADEWSPRLRSCLSIPLMSEDRVMAVLTLYSATSEFDEQQTQIAELLASQLSEVMATPLANERRHERLGTDDQPATAVVAQLSGDPRGKNNVARFDPHLRRSHSRAAATGAS